MTYVLLFAVVLVGCLFLWHKVLPYVLDFLEDVVTYFVRRRQRRNRRKLH